MPKNTRVSALLPTNIVKKMKEIAQNEGITQSYIMKNALEFWLSKKLENDVKALSEMDFDDLPTEEEWQSTQSEIN